MRLLMTLLEATLIFATQLMDHTNHGMQYNHQVMNDAVAAIVEVTESPQEIETLVKIARYESGAWRKEVADCRIRGDEGGALGLFQVHVFPNEKASDACSSDYRKQVRVALAHVRNSAEICGMHGYRRSSLLTIYTNGSCRLNSSAARLRYGSGKELQALLYTEENEMLSKKDVPLNGCQ
jgi:hypothetical protein